MKREELEKIGLDNEQIDQILSLHHAEIDLYKSKLEAVTKKDEEHSKALNDLKSEYDKAVKNSSDIEALKAQIETQIEEAKKKEAAIKSKYKDQLKQSIIQRELAKVGVRNPQAVTKLLDDKNISLSEDETQVTGLGDQIKALRDDETLSSLFEQGNTSTKDYNYSPQGSVENVRTNSAKDIYNSINHNTALGIKKLGG